MKKWFSDIVLALAAAVVAMPAAAQTHPLPRSTSESPSICTGCNGTNSAGEPNDGKPTYPYESPLKDFVGRYVDSTTTKNVQNVGMRTVRSGKIRVAPTTRRAAPPRVYLALGEAVGAYDMNTLFTQTLPGGTDPVNQIGTGQRYGGRSPYEQVMLPDTFLYPEAADSGWDTPLIDGQDRLFDFDYDDRGYLYAAYSTFGWGIAEDDGSSGVKHMPFVYQKLDSEIFARTIVALKAGSKYYAVVGNYYDPTMHVLWDVTDPAAPTRIAVRSGRQHGILAWSRYAPTNRLAYIDGNGRLRIFDNASFVSTSASIVEYDPPSGKTFSDLSFDDDGSLWVAVGGWPGHLWKLTPSGSSYVLSTYSPFSNTFSPTILHASAGFIAVGGLGTEGGAPLNLELRLLRVEGAAVQQLDIKAFFRKYYHAAPSGYAGPAGYVSDIKGVRIVKWNGKTYLFYSVNGLGDVFEIEGTDAVSIAMKTNSFGEVNPSARSTDTGPFYGDIVRFSSGASSPSASYNLVWEFGNPEAGVAGNTDTEAVGTDVSHQYTGLTTSEAISAPKSVTAEVTTDSSIKDATVVNLKVPTARIGIPATTEPLTTGGAARFPVVAGEEFSDASDGSVESHYVEWVIDGQTTKKKPNATMPVGGIGDHTLDFIARYGHYDATALTNSTPFTRSITPVLYEVRPFLVTLRPPDRTSTTVTFDADARWTTDTDIMSTTQWTVTWKLTSPGISATAVSPPQTSTVAVGDIPPFTVDLPLDPGTIVSLDVVVDPNALSTPAKAYATVGLQSVLSTPDPKITTTGCANALGPCTFTAGSVSGGSISDWTLLWTLTGPSGTRTSSAATFSPELTASGTHNIALKATKSVFDATLNSNFAVAAALCGPPPTIEQVAITVSCSTCSAGSAITFRPSFFGYTAQSCDEYSWNFADGSTSTDKNTAHSFSSDGSYAVKLKVSNSSNSTGITITKTVTIGSGTTPPPPPPPPPPCSAPSNIQFTYVGSKGCAPGIDCRTDESIKFTAKRGSSSLATCDNTAWDMGDGSEVTTKSPSKTYKTAGSYSVSLVVSNTSGTSAPVTRTIKVVAAPTGSCTLVPNEGNLIIKYTGQTSGCSATNGVPCGRGENIFFETKTFGYTLQSCDQAEWNFGDGTTAATIDSTHAFGGSAGSYHVTLKVSNTGGGATIAVDVPMSGAAIKPVPRLTSSFPATGSKGHPVTFTVTSDIDATGWAWSFGDNAPTDNSQAGDQAKSRTITHVFNKTGTFNVKVSARNAADTPTAPLGSLTKQITINDTPEFRFLLPVVTHGKGFNSVWRTDVQFYTRQNVSVSNPMIVTATFKGTDYPLSITKSTQIEEDFMGTLLGKDVEEQGPVMITVKTDKAPQIWTRTYNVSEAGTFGQFIPAIQLDADGTASAASDGKYFIVGLRVDNRYRTNIGLVNPTLDAMTVTVKVYDGQHSLKGAFQRTLQPFYLDQFPINTGLVPDLPTNEPFSIQIETPAGKWVLA